MHNEADRFIINIIPKIFNFNLDLHILHGTSSNKTEKTSYIIKNIQSLDSQNTPTISLLYKFQNFGILYSTDYVKTAYSSVVNSTKIQTKPNVKLLSLGMSHCKKCSKDTESISFNHLQNFSVCRICCEKTINRILNSRVKQFINEDFINIECKY